ncbi:MAG TPA: heavy metal-responsive transcriptional regulator [Jatrophihabitans sp.]|jgi:DNA-binding transcriptional MerR regulator|uniref:heavy metal-responsive transcriptional regulator n=1 Tax=Jatrophihabitans sp. TaxID=1932789 RepID=UPI002F135DCF
MAARQLDQNSMTVAVLARAAGSTPDTVRYYERLGLLPEPPRSGTGYRRYGPDAVDRLKFIQGTQRLGLRLSDIAELLSIRDTGTCPCGDAVTVLHKRMDEVRSDIQRLTSLLQDLQHMVDQLPSQDCPNPEPGVWKPPLAEPA